MTRHWGARGRLAGPPPDSGLQAERTAMAWQRTALALGGVSALLLHGASRPATAAPGLLGLAAALLLLGRAELRYVRTVRRAEDGRAPSSPRLLLGAAVAAVALAVAATTLVALGAVPGPGRA